RPSLQPLRKVVKIRLQVPSVVVPRFAVDPCRRVQLHREIGCAQALHVVHVVEKRREPLSPIPLGCLTYTLKRAGRASPALSPERVALGRVPLGLLPSLPCLRGPFRGLVRQLPRYYGAVRLPVLVHHRRASSDFSMRPWCAPRQARDLPVPGRDASARARGLRPRRVLVHLAVAMDAMWPSARFHSVGTLEVNRISRLNTRPTRAPVNASPSSLRASGA